MARSKKRPAASLEDLYDSKTPKVRILKPRAPSPASTSNGLLASTSNGFVASTSNGFVASSSTGNKAESGWSDEIFKERIRVHDWMADYDKLNSGRMLKINFRRAISLCTLGLQESEMAILEDHYETAGDPLYVDFMRFDDDMEKVFTTKHMATVDPHQFRLPEQLRINELLPHHDALLQKCLQRIADKTPSSSTSPATPAPLPAAQVQSCASPAPPAAQKLVLVPDTNWFLDGDVNLLAKFKAALELKFGREFVIAIAYTVLTELERIKNRQNKPMLAIKAQKATILIRKWFQSNDLTVIKENPQETAVRRLTMIPIANPDDKILEYALHLQSLFGATFTALLTQDRCFSNKASANDLKNFDINEFRAWLSSVQTHF